MPRLFFFVAYELALVFTTASSGECVSECKASALVQLHRGMSQWTLTSSGAAERDVAAVAPDPKLWGGGSNSFGSAAMLATMACVLCLFLCLLAWILTKAPKTPKTRRSISYSLVALAALGAAALGFAPGLIVAFERGQFYGDAFALQNRPSVNEAMVRLGSRWRSLLIAHVVASLGWLFLATAQVSTAASASGPGSWQMRWHRTAGVSVAILGLLAILLGTALELQKHIRGEQGEGLGSLITVLGSAFAVATNLAEGTYCVVAIRDIQRHKIAMAWACAWSADAGGLRICSYMLRITLGVGAFDVKVVCGANFIFTAFLLAGMLTASLRARDAFGCNILSANILGMSLRLASMMYVLTNALWTALLLCALCLPIAALRKNAAPVLEPLASSVPVSGWGLVDGRASQQAGDSGDGHQSELITNPQLLFAFRSLVRRPGLSSCMLAALFLGSCTIATQYARLKNEPLRLEPFGTRLKEAQVLLRRSFASHPKDTLHSSVLIWSTDASDIRGSAALRDVSAAAKAALRQLNETSADCESLKWWSASDAVLRPDLKPLFETSAGDATLLHLQFHGQLAIGQRSPCITKVRHAVSQLDGRHGLRVVMASPDAVIDASQEQCERTTSWHLILSIPVMATLLMLGVGNAARGVTPFLCLLGSIQGTRATMVLIKWCWRDFNFSGPDTMIEFVLLALSLDYALFFWKRFADERRSWPDRQSETGLGDCTMKTLTTSGYVIILSMVVLVLTFVVGAVYPDHNKTGYLGSSFQLISGVILCAFYSLTIPVVLAVQLPSIFDEPGQGKALWPAQQVARWMMARPRWTRWVGEIITQSPCVFVVPVVMCICLVPLLISLQHVELSFDSYANFASKTVPEFDAHDIYASRFDLGRLSPATVLLQAAPLGQATFEEDPTLSKPFGVLACDFLQLLLKECDDLEVRAADIESIWWDSARGACAPEPQRGGSWQELLSTDGLGQLVKLRTRSTGEAGAAAQAMVRRFWSRIEPQTRGTFNLTGDSRAYEFLVSLDTPLAEDMLMEEKYAELFPWVLLANVAVICCVVGFCSSSAFVAGKLVFTVVIPILAEYGILVGIYQYGWLELLGIERTRGISWTLLFNSAGFLFAMAMDYDLFLLARVLERRREGYDNRSAVRIALEETGPVIALAGTMMVGTFFFIFLSDVPMVSQLGCLYCFGVAIDTYIVRSWIAPAVLCIYEPMNYWPGKVPPVTKTYEDHDKSLPDETFNQSMS